VGQVYAEESRVQQQDGLVRMALALMVQTR
jgi:hypothetical protein